eukprot:gnl/MRDRNA2_/MRDRNA2_26999_c0_seq1.p1 gnl/MRDRNA2_/MRDRNA2_26999_c0~~gnl/MRDRNA2_/MRDRNA2_26999_c0_seq1.p1  ORF type:complete len:288 (+),score=48.70 gnl/MRDRNA2_/MRDRNA2_26999_c0_seq1:85-948(+)
MGIAFLVLGALIGQCASIPKHALFEYEAATGLIQPTANKDLRLNVKGGALEPGSPVILWNCGPLNHELFKIDNGLIKLKVDEKMCLNVAGGVSPGAKLTLWPCEHEGIRVPHEQFDVRQDGRIALTHSPDMCLNVKGGAVQHGAEVILWPCGNGTDTFTVSDGYIQVQSNPKFHFNIQGELKAESQVVLWSCQAGPHEAFEFTGDSRIRLKMKNDLCLNSEAGVRAGHRIVVWPCSTPPAENELFEYDKDRNVIYSMDKTEMGFNAAGGGMKAGDEIVLWPFEDEEL